MNVCYILTTNTVSRKIHRIFRFWPTSQYQFSTCWRRLRVVFLDAYEKLEDLRILLQTNCQLPDEACAQFFVSASDMDTVTKAAIMQEFQEAFRLSAEKVQKYIDGGYKVWEGVSHIKTTEYCFVVRNKKDYHAISGMSDIEVAEFVKYVDVIGLEVVRSSSSDKYDTDSHYHILEKHIRQTAGVVKTGTDVHFFSYN